MPKLFSLLFAGFVALVLWVLWTQILSPASEGRALFPILRSKRREVEHTISDIKENLDIEAAEAKAEELAKGLRKKQPDETKDHHE